MPSWMRSENVEVGIVILQGDLDYELEVRYDEFLGCLTVPLLKYCLGNLKFLIPGKDGVF